MPARRDLKSICVLGSGPIVIGQAAEFDYSGTQAVKALKKDGYRVILVNSNPATIMTDVDVADATYVEPLVPEVVREILRKEKPDAVLPTVGGQTGLNLAVALAKDGTLDELGIELIGAELDVIERAEDRQLFKECMTEIGLDTVRSEIVHTMDEAWVALEKLGLPIIIRPSFTLGGAGGGVARTREEYQQIVESGLQQSPTTEVLVEESILGWKEFEMEVMRDKADNTVIVCSIENLDPMGVHTGDSITVAPAQTLTDREYQILRDASLAVMRAIGVKTGGSNVQFAVNPENGRVVVIEMNPRVSRSSALASKATGYPIAKIAAQVAVGYTLDEIENDITKKTKAAFEPALDYVVVKIPRFNFEKFRDARRELSTQMRSVGEAMAIGRTFTEALSKALRSLELGSEGVDSVGADKAGGQMPTGDALLEAVMTPSPERLWQVAHALREGVSVDALFERTAIDRYFLNHIARILAAERALAKLSTPSELDEDLLWEVKGMVLSDAHIASSLGAKCDEADIKARRDALDVKPVFKRVDTCAAEFVAHTPYLYSTFEKPHFQLDGGVLKKVHACEADPTDRQKIMILGGGPIRIGQGIEFDYCCVQAAFALKDVGFETVMVNCNPETVSTDYDTADRLYFEPLTYEHVMAVIEKEKPHGVIVQFGGQTPLKLAGRLEAAGVNVIGTPPDAIDLAEDRERFGKLVSELGLDQPEAGIATSLEEAEAVATRLGFPVLLRPSYVLGGRAMETVHDLEGLRRYMKEAVVASEDRPVLVDRFLDGAIEVDVDVLADGEDAIVAGVLQHVQEAGVHSGDSASVIPPHSLDFPVVEEICDASRKLALRMGVSGLMNAQFAVRRNRVFVLEVNPRASRTVPFVSKATGLPLARLASRVMAGERIRDLGVKEPAHRREAVPYVAVKESVMPFLKFSGADTVLGPEMRSTGEVMGIAPDYASAFSKSQVSAGMHLPQEGTLFVSVADVDKEAMLPVVRRMSENGFSIIATGGTARFLAGQGIDATRINKVYEGSPHILDAMREDRIQLLFNTTIGAKSVKDSFSLRREGLERGIPYYTTVASAEAASLAIAQGKSGITQVASLQEHLARKEAGERAR
jgi:carbamoyl-phosphate synthase large subunit